MIKFILCFLQRPKLILLKTQYCKLNQNNFAFHIWFVLSGDRRLAGNPVIDSKHNSLCCRQKRFPVDHQNKDRFGVLL